MRIGLAMLSTIVLLVASVAVLTAAVDRGESSDTSSAPPFEPITIQRIDLPPKVTEASSPVFTHDGDHVLFFADQQLWIVDTDGSAPNCLSCGLANRPTLSPSEQEGFATPFPTGDGCSSALRTA